MLKKRVLYLSSERVHLILTYFPKCGRESIYFVITLPSNVNPFGFPKYT